MENSMSSFDAAHLRKATMIKPLRGSKIGEGGALLMSRVPPAAVSRQCHVDRLSLLVSFDSVG